MLLTAELSAQPRPSVPSRVFVVQWWRSCRSWPCAGGRHPNEKALAETPVTLIIEVWVPLEILCLRQVSPRLHILAQINKIEKKNFFKSHFLWTSEVPPPVVYLKMSLSVDKAAVHKDVLVSCLSRGNSAVTCLPAAGDGCFQTRLVPRMTQNTAVLNHVSSRKHF